MIGAGALTRVLDLLLPCGCLTCGAWLPEGVERSLLCGRCRASLPVAPRPRCPRCDAPRGTGRVPAPTCRECAAWPDTLARARHAYVLAPPADRVVHALKYEGWSELSGEMGRALARASPPLDGSAVVVPVPTTERRLRSRGYNQAELLARALAKELGRPLVLGLVRARAGHSQVALHPSQRRANVQGAFAPSPNASRTLGGRPVLLVDDVLTTGATAVEASLALREAGAGEVTLLTYARALAARDRDAP